jgi:GT2 family glycosyltransferase
MMTRSERPRVAIIILNWNGWEDTIECLESLYQVTYPDYEIVLVDNASTDESLRMIKAYCEGTIEVGSRFVTYTAANKPIAVVEYTKAGVENVGRGETGNMPHGKKLVLIKNDQNYGFAEGNNIGIGYAERAIVPDYVLLLNNDTVVAPDFLGGLVAVAEADKKVGVVGPKIYYYDYGGRDDIIWFNGGAIDWRKYPCYFNIVQYRADPGDGVARAVECDWITGAAMMMRVNGSHPDRLNKKFYFGCEDIDFCMRARHNGYMAAVVPDSKIWHKVGVSRKKKYGVISWKQLIGIRTNFQLIKAYNHKYYLYIPLYLTQLTVKIFGFFLRRLMMNPSP